MFVVDAGMLGALTFSVSTEVVIVAVVAFVIGLVVAFLAVTPAKTRSDYVVRGHAQRARMLEQQISDLQSRNDQLQEQNSSLVAERNHLRGQLDALREHTVAAARGNADGDGATATDQALQRDREQDQMRAQESEQQREQDQAEAQQPPEQQESFGERVKDFFRGNNPDNTNPDNTEAPTPNATA